MKVEKAMFETATSREAYYQLLTEKIYRIRKELEERKKIRMVMEQQGQSTAQGLSKVVYTTFERDQFPSGMPVGGHNLDGQERQGPSLARKSITAFLYALTCKTVLLITYIVIYRG